MASDLWASVEDQYEAVIDARKVCRGCGSVTRHIEDGYCHRCNAEPLQSDEYILARKRRLRPDWFDLDGQYDPLGRGRR